MRSANKSVEANRRPASPFNTDRSFQRASSAPPSLSAAVAHLCRWPEMSMRRFAFLLPCCLLLVACSARKTGSSVAPTRQIESRTNNAALTSKMVFVGMPEQEALRRLQSSGAREVGMQTKPFRTGWVVSGSHSHDTYRSCSRPTELSPRSL